MRSSLCGCFSAGCEWAERLSCVARCRVIWNSLLPHGAGVNRSDASRVVQYCGLSPTGESTPEGLAARRQFHADRTGSPRLGMPPERGGPTVFHSARARRLAGLEAWPGGLTEAPPHGRLPGAARQYLAIMASGPRVELLKTVKVPTLVLHGEDDPLLPVECGRDVAALVPGAKIETFPGWGHDVPKEMVPKLVQSITAFCKAA